jgi:hypothetical protein
MPIISREVRVYVANPDFIAESCALKFTLTYEGSLFKNRAAHKQPLRGVFHNQLKRLWAVNNLLKNWFIGKLPACEYLRINTAKIGEFEYVPIVTKALCVECALDFKILRPTDKPGNQSDIDNLVGIFFDALKRPQDGDQLGKENGVLLSPKDDEKPFYVLMDDDKLITKISSTSDELLCPVNGGTSIGPNDIRVMIDIYIRPILPLVENMIFFSEDRGVWDHKYDEAIPENLSDLSPSQLKSYATQCIFRIIAMAKAFEPWRAINPSVTMNFNEQNSKLLSDSSTMNNIWRTELQPKAFSIKRELLRRVYGQGPYPTSQRSVAIDLGMLSGVAPLTDAALELDSLVRALPA